MEREGQVGEERLAERVSEAFASHHGRRLEDLDRLLTDCAAKALRLQAERVRTERAQEEAAKVANGTARDLAEQKAEVEAEQRRLSELMESLRDLRDRVARSEAA
jgi:hypothetical protein